MALWIDCRHQFYKNFKNSSWPTWTHFSDWSHMLCFSKITNMIFCLCKHVATELVRQYFQSGRAWPAERAPVHLCASCAWKLQHLSGGVEKSSVLQRAKNRKKKCHQNHPLQHSFQSQTKAQSYHLYSFKYNFSPRWPSSFCHVHFHENF